MILNMWSRFCLTFMLAAGIALGQTQMNVEQLVDFVKSEVALHQHSDKQIAAGLHDIQLTEKLTDSTIIDLQAHATLGPKTVEALKSLRDASANIKPAAQPEQVEPENHASLEPKPPAAPPPSDDIQREILGEIRDYAENYTKHLPNFFCVEVTHQYIDPNGGQNYQHAGIILAKLGYNDGQERYNVYSLNGKLVDTSMDNVKTGGATSQGEFYSLMKTIFDPVSEAEIHWDHWARLRGRTMAIFNYFIDSAHSIWYIEDKNSDQRIKTAYRGLIYADPHTGEIDRIRFEAVDIPKSFPISATSEILDYDLVAISGQQFVLPLTAKLFMKDGRESSKNEIEFRLYRKFDADTFIKYNLDPNATPDVDNSTGEKPAVVEPEKPATPVPQQQPTTPPTKQRSPWVLPTLDDVPPPPPR